MARTRRTSGYHYVRLANGRKKRVYSGRKTKRTTRTSKRRSSAYSYRGMGDSIMGYGGYRRSGHSIKNGMSPPQVINSRGGGFIVRHREFIENVPASAAFVIAGFPLNPGLPGTFPWLSNVAKNFEEWVPRGIVFEFKTTSSNAVVSTAANAALGTVIMATEYNPLNPGFGNKQQMENYQWAVSTNPSRSKIHMVETAKSQNPLGSYYIRTGAVPSNGDARFYDIGTTYVASDGMQSSGTYVGELWISYEVELRKPRLESGEPTAAGPAVDHFSLIGTDLSSAKPATPFGTGTAGLIFPTTNSNLGGVLSGGIVAKANQPRGGVITALDASGDATGEFEDSAANTYYFPPGITGGTYIMSYNALYTTGGADWAPTFTITNGTSKNLLSVNTVAAQANLSATTSVSCMATAFITVTKGNAKISITGSNGAYATPVYVDFFMMEMPSNIN